MSDASAGRAKVVIERFGQELNYGVRLGYFLPLYLTADLVAPNRPENKPNYQLTYMLPERHAYVDRDANGKPILYSQK